MNSDFWGLELEPSVFFFFALVICIDSKYKPIQLIYPVAVWAVKPGVLSQQE